MTIMLEKRQRLLPEGELTRRRWRSNPSGKCSQERLTRGSTVRRAAHPSGRARCGAGAGCPAIRYQCMAGPVGGGHSMLFTSNIQEFF
jgi:hypothetical protein